MTCPYWARRRGGETGHVSPLSVFFFFFFFFFFFYKSELEGDGCRVNHAEERPILLSVPW